MALAVSFSKSLLHDRSRLRAIYLDQQFYELIYGVCRAEDGCYSVLRKIAMLKYKSPTLVVFGDRLALLIQELTSLVESGVSHPQISEFTTVCHKAVSTGCALTISGDMYPEMW